MNNIERAIRHIQDAEMERGEEKCEMCGRSEEVDCGDEDCCRTSDGGGDCPECERCMCECHNNNQVATTSMQVRFATTAGLNQ